MKDQPYISPEEVAAAKKKYPHLITRTELLASGALYVPPEARKSLSWKPKKNEQYPLFGDDDEPVAESQPDDEDLTDDDQ